MIFAVLDYRKNLLIPTKTLKSAASNSGTVRLNLTQVLHYIGKISSKSHIFAIPIGVTP
jgi:hypothetical protein